MKKTSIFAIFLSLAVALHLQQKASGAEAPPPLPSGPLLNRAPDFSQWSVTTVNGTAKSKDAEKTGEKAQGDQNDMQSTVTKTKKIYHIQSVDGLGGRSDKWSVDGFQVSFLPNTQFPIISAPGITGGGYYTDFSNTDFSGFEWISASNYTGVQKVSGIDCYIFKSNIKLPHTDGLTEATAALDVKTRLPLSLVLGAAVTTYQYGSAPTAMLVPPANVKDLADKWQKRMQQASAMPPP